MTDFFEKKILTRASERKPPDTLIRPCPYHYPEDRTSTNFVLGHIEKTNIRVKTKNNRVNIWKNRVGAAVCTHFSSFQSRTYKPFSRIRDLPPRKHYMDFLCKGNVVVQHRQGFSLFS
jgi:hypothetical protein